MDQLSSAEINEAVARKLGWMGIGEPQVYEPPKDGSNVWPVRATIPDYCRSIEAAWEIVEKC